MTSPTDINEAEKEPGIAAQPLRDPQEPERRYERPPAAVEGVRKGDVPSRRKGIIGLLLAILIVSFLGGLGGSWAFQNWGLGGSGTTTIKESKERVLAEGEVVSDVAKSVSPSVVSIITESTSNSAFYGPVSQQGAGTGVIISKDGYVLTNKHVIPDSVDAVSVELADGTAYDNVEVIGRDPSNDLAFLKISGANNLTPAVLGDSSKMTVGQKVVAIGNALGQYQTTVTSGIISGIGRPVTASDESNNATETLTNLFQTDAAINPGNSGGPLVNLNNQVIGINVAVAADAQGIGFAIPINDAKGLIESVLKTGKVTRPFIGVRYVMLSASIAKELGIDQTKGAYVGPGTNAAISTGSPAEKAGLKKGDIILKINSIELTETLPLASAMSQFRPGDTVTLTIFRDGKNQQLKLTLGSSNG